MAQLTVQPMPATTDTSPQVSDGPAPVDRRWRHRFACLLVIATFILVVSGGNVTSRDAGLSVPDGFTVYGHFLWAFPRDMWVGNIFHEHIHRLKGSIIGLMSIALAIWLWRTEPARPWLRRFGLVVLAMVIVQGIMGGLRVEFVNRIPSLATPFAVLHGITGQVFLCMTVVAAAATSRYWQQHTQLDAEATPAQITAAEVTPVRRATTCLIAVLLAQLVLGAAMRHTQSGLAIPDFPASYGGALPPFSAQGIEAARTEMAGDDLWAFEAQVAPPQVMVHFAHRMWAILVVVGVIWAAWRVAPMVIEHRILLAPLAGIGVLILLQILFGALIIWTGRHADTATAHQATGALILALAVLLALRVRLITRPREAHA